MGCTTSGMQVLANPDPFHFVLLFLSVAVGCMAAVFTRPYLGRADNLPSAVYAIILVAAYDLSAGLFAAGLGNWSALAVVIIMAGVPFVLVGIYGFGLTLHRDEHEELALMMRAGAWLMLFMVGLGVFASASFV